MNIEFITVLLFLTMLVLILLGLPVAFVLGGMVVTFTIFWWKAAALYQIASTVTGFMSNFIILAIPLFILLANILQRSGIADDMYKAMHLWFGPIKGGLAIGTIIMATVFAAMRRTPAARAKDSKRLISESMVPRKPGKLDSWSFDFVSLAIFPLPYLAGPKEWSIRPAPNGQAKARPVGVTFFNERHRYLAI